MKSATAPALNGSGIVWEDVPCPLCGEKDEGLLLKVPGDGEADGYRLVRCRACGMGYVNPRPDEKSITRFYPEDYKPHQPGPGSDTGSWTGLRRRFERLVLSELFDYPPPLTSRVERTVARFAAPWVAPRRDSHTSIPFIGEGKLLDFGCGSGWFARRMKERGWDVTGIDFSARAARQVSEATGIPVHVGTLPHPLIGPESFDVVNMGAVLEHVHWPHRVIEAAGRALRPGGLLVASVPNLASWGFRAFGLDWFTLDVPRHLLHFTPATLCRLVESHGLAVVELRMLGRASWMRRNLGNLARNPAVPRSRRLLARLGRAGIVSGLLTRWTVRARRADCMMVIAQSQPLAA